MSTFFNDIQATFDTKLAATVSDPIAYPNVPYEPESDTVYIRPTFLPTDTVQASLGTTGKDETNGIYQIEVIVPRGSGRPQAVDSIADAFKRGTVLTYNDVTIRIRSVSIGVAVFTRESTVSQNTAWYSVPVSVNFQTYTEARS